jgi:hypothetical protein
MLEAGKLVAAVTSSAALDRVPSVTPVPGSVVQARAPSNADARRHQEASCKNPTISGPFVVL